MKDNIIKLKTSRSDGPSKRIVDAKWGYATRRVTADRRDLRLAEHVVPRAGDLVLAKVVRLGQHKRIELVNGRRARMFVGDDIVVAYGNRYAPDQFEAIVPLDLEPCHLAAAGGIAGQMIHKHESMRNPTRIRPVGLVADTAGRVLNLSQFAIDKNRHNKPLPPVIAVVGGSMNAGKTTTVASLVHGLTRAGFKVSAGKVTGTGSGCDAWHIQDAGADLVMDFLDTGHPSTYLLSPSQVEDILETLLFHLNQEGPDFIILEVADGLFQSETVELIKSPKFQNSVNGVLYAASDALSAAHGFELLQRWAVPVFGISGVISRSPLGVREVLDAVDVPVLGRDVLASPHVVSHVTTWLNHEETITSIRGNGR